jgi:hypothetical protein
VYNTKYVVFVIASLVFLVTAGWAQSPFAVLPILAEPPDPCFGKHVNVPGCSNMDCSNDPQNLQAICCWDSGSGRVCQACQVNTDTGEFENCSEVLSKGRPDTNTIAPPPSGVAPPPSATTTCPENTALDANGNCAPVTQAPPSTDQGTTTTQLPPPSDNNKPLKHKLPKGDILGELPHSGEELTAKKKNNKDNSPTPPACPTDNSPIPPNCTLKPKF